MKKKLYRSKDNRVVGGVCGGLGDFFEIDPTVIRLAFAFLIFIGGTGVLAYLIAWLIVPEAPDKPKKSKKK